MNSKLKLLSLLFIVTATSLINLNAQIQENYFADDELKEGGKVYCSTRYADYVIAGGRSFDKVRYNSNIICFDTTGKVVWQTIDNDTSNYDGKEIIHSLLLASDNFLYALQSRYVWPQTIYQMWKVDPKDGSIVWKKDMPKTIPNNSLGQLTDYDSTRLICTYRSNYKGSFYGLKLVTINKSDGSITSDAFLGSIHNNWSGHFIAIDKSKNLFYSLGDTIIKLDGIDTSKVLWKKAYPSEKIAFFGKGLFDNTSSNFFVLGTHNTTHNRGVYLKIDPTNGNLIFKKTVFDGFWFDMSVADAVIKKGVLYATWHHIYTGGNPRYFYTIKHDIAKDSLLWQKWHNFSYGSTQVPLSFDLDDNNDIYLTGIVAGFYPGGGAWITVKLDGNKGDTIYHKLISQDSSVIDKHSAGNGVFIINNKPYYVGTFQTSPVNSVDKTAIALVSADPDNGKVIFKKDHYGSYQYKSSTISIQKYSHNKVLVMKQVGKGVEVEMYDSSKKLKWAKRLNRAENFLLGDKIKVFDNSGDIYIGTHSVHKTYYKTYFLPSENVDSFHVYRLDSVGSIKQEISFRHVSGASSNNSSIVDLLPDGSDFLIFYNKGNESFVRRSSSTSIYGYTYTSKSNYILDFDSSRFLMFSGTSVNELSKSDLKTSNYSYLTSNQKVVTQTHEIGNRLIMCGTNNNSAATITFYDYENKNIIWSKSFSSDGVSNIVIGAPNDTKNFFYLVSDIPSGIAIRKIETANGSVNWTYKYNTSNSAPINLSYDYKNRHLLITGYEGNSNNVKALVMVVDSTGKLLTKIVRNGDFSGYNTGTSTYVWDDGIKWVGGNLNKQPYGLAGFIWGIEKCFTDSSSITVNTCNNYNSPSGKYTWNTTGMYYDTVTNGSGCDSIIKIDLTINNSTAATISETSCNTFLSPSGKYLWNTTGTYNDTITNTTGCDSIITVNLTISTFSTSTINETVCDSYTSPSGKHVWLTSGTYKDTILTQNGCDSIVTINLTIRTLNTAVTNTNNTLSANLSGAAYQWINCNGNTVISGAISQSYTPSANGSYSVIITDNTCTDTSSCIAVTNVSVNKVNSSIDELVSISPNPSSGIYSITFKKEFNPIQIELYDAIGKLIYSSQTIKGSGYYELDLSTRKNGIYYIQFNEGGNYLGRKKLIKF